MRLRNTVNACALLAAALGGTIASTVPTYADTASDMHDALKERWYTTEVIVFRSNNPPRDESLLKEGERISVAEEKLRLNQAVSEGFIEETFVEGESTGDERAPQEEASRDNFRGQIAINQLTLPDPEGEEGPERPALDAEPWETIKDYDAADDLGELVARNMATWETQLRDLDGQWLDEEQLTLSDAADRLRKSRSLEVLMHAGWIQAVPARDAARPISIEAGDTYIEAATGETRSRLAGEIAVTLGRYLHVHPSLFYSQVSEVSEPPPIEDSSTMPINPLAQRGPAVRELSSTASRAFDRNLRAQDPEPLEPDYPAYVRLDQSRRVRSGELHYIDHPELRMLVRVTPVVASELLQEQFALLQ